MVWYWHRVLRALGQASTGMIALRAFWIGHLGKYVPGKLLVVVLRSALVGSPRRHHGLIVLSVFVETLTYMSVGALLAAGILVIRFRGQWKLQLIAAGFVLLFTALMAPPVTRRLVAGMQGRRDRTATTAPLQLPARLLAEGWGASVVSWSLASASLWATLNALPGIVPVPFSFDVMLRLTAALTLAVVAGFASLLPGGLGVREWVLHQLMFPEFWCLCHRRRHRAADGVAADGSGGLDYPIPMEAPFARFHLRLF